MCLPDRFVVTGLLLCDYRSVGGSLTNPETTGTIDHATDTALNPPCQPREELQTLAAEQLQTDIKCREAVCGTSG